MIKNETVGYKNPPKSTRFQPGLSGNPSGRPKKQKTIASEIVDELDNLITVRQGGRRITKARAIANALVQLAIDGDLRAVTTVLSVTASSDHDIVQNSNDDQAIVDSFVEREIRRRAAKTNDSSRKDSQ